MASISVGGGRRAAGGGRRAADELDPNSHFEYWPTAGTSSPRCSLYPYSARTDTELGNRFLTATLTEVTIAGVVTGSP
jgi:hypothetical protein